MDQAEALKPFRAVRGRFGPPGRARWQGNHRWAADRSWREGSAVRLRHNRFGVVVPSSPAQQDTPWQAGERVIVAGFDDPFVRFWWRACREDAHALFPQSEMAQDAVARDAGVPHVPGSSGRNAHGDHGTQGTRAVGLVLDARCESARTKELPGPDHGETPGWTPGAGMRHNGRTTCCSPTP